MAEPDNPVEGGASSDEARQGFVKLDGRGPSAAERQRAEHLVHLLQSIVPDLQDPAVAAQALHDVSRLLARTLGDTAGALAAAREAYMRQPKAPHIARGYRRAVMWHGEREELPSALQAEARATSNAADRAPLELARGRLLETELDNPEAAREAYLAALGTPHHALLALTALERLAGARGDLEEAADFARQQAETVSDPRLQGEHYARAARHLAAAGQSDAALAHAARALVGAPTSPAVGFLLERVYGAAGAYSELTALRERQIEEGVVPKEAAWFDVGVVALYRAKDPQLAIRAFTEALNLATMDSASRLTTLRELAAALRETGQWEHLVAVEEERASIEIEPSERAAAWYGIGTVHETSLGDDETALIAHEKALEQDGSFYPALQAAGRIFGRLGTKDRLLRMHRIEAERAASPAERSSALRRMGDLLVQEDDTRDEGVEVLRSAVDLDASNLPAIACLERALADQRDWTDLIEVYETVLQRTEDPQRRGSLLRKIATVASEHLEDRSRAIDALAEATELDIGGPPEPLRMLAQLLEDEGDVERLSPVLERIAAMETDPLQKASQLERLASVHERGGDMETAVEVYQRALTVAPAGHPVLVSAGRAFLLAEHYEELAKLFVRAGSTGSPRERATWLHKAAEVMTRYLDRPTDAAEMLEAAVSMAPDLPPPRIALETLQRSAKRWEDLDALLADREEDGAVLLRRAVAAEAGGDDRKAADLYARAAGAGVDLAVIPCTRLLAAVEDWQGLVLRYQSTGRGGVTELHGKYRAAEIAAERLGDGPLALELLGEILREEPEEVAAVLASTALVDKDLVRKQGLLAKLTALTDDTAVQQACLTDISLALDELHDEEAGLEARLRLLEGGIRDPLLAVALEVELERRGERKKLVTVLRQLLATPRLPDELAADMHGHLSALLEELGAAQQAAEALETSFRHEGGYVSLSSRFSLSRLYRTLGDLPRYAETLEELAESLPPGPERATVLRVIGDALAETVGGPSHAARAFENALRDDPCDYPTLRRLDAFLTELQEPERIIEHLQRAFAAESDPIQGAALGSVLARKLLKAGRVEPAREVLDRTLARAPSHLDGLMMLAELRRGLGDWRGAVDALWRVAEHGSATLASRRDALYYIVLIAVRKLDDPEVARQAARSLTSKTGTDVEDLITCASVQDLIGDDEGLASTLEDLSDRKEVDELKRAEYLLRLSRLQERALGDASAAMETLGRVRDSGFLPSALVKLVALAEDTGRAEDAAATLEAAFDRGAVLEEPVELELRSRLVELLDGPLEKPAAAVSHYERIAELDPDNVDVLARLADLRFGDDALRAIDNHRALLERQPDRVTSYRKLRELLLESGDEDGAFCVEATLVGLGCADEEETYFHAQRRNRLSPRLGGSLAEEVRFVLCPELSEPPMVLLAALTPALAELFPSGLAAHGVSDLGRPGDESLPELAEALASSFGVGPVEVVLVPSRIGPSVEAGDPARLLLPRTLADAMPREQMFVLGALIGRIALGGLLADPRRLHPLTPQQLEFVAQAACELVVPGYHGEDRPSAVFDDIKRRLSGALGTPAPKEVVAAAERVAAAGIAVEGVALAAAMSRGAARAAVLASLDPAAAMKGLRDWSTMFDSGGGGGSGPFGLCAEALAGPVFAVSAEHVALREQLGVGVRP